jgi:hypothetical protein
MKISIKNLEILKKLSPHFRKVYISGTKCELATEALEEVADSHIACRIRTGSGSGSWSGKKSKLTAILDNF